MDKNITTVNAECYNLNNVEEEITFSEIKNHLDHIILPFDKWGFTRGNTSFFGLQRVEDNYDIRKRVAVFSNMKVFPVTNATSAYSNFPECLYHSWGHVSFKVETPYSYFVTPSRQEETEIF
ncbi:uncharacterized protein LOC127278500 [Leptopilina boulardi]|uniref:uncharacterized protein LOC127278500 n=1 Tax=Leptopilina boulardi TaxID=63433 RepID=UPI0021F62B47|nr:uncharacterized protein LOC127278500 [Leptopilina boulardi]